MSFQTFDQLDPRNRRSTVPAFVSRLWHHRGGTDVGPIKHTDLVLLDSKGNHIYAEISADVVPKFIDILEEGRVYELSKILVFPNKRSYRSVESRLMIRITKFTKPVPVEGIEDQFPHCTYALTPFSSLPDPTDLPERFTDVIGAITSVSNVGEFYSINRTEPSFKRVITLTDRMGQKLNVVLWGQRAKEFEEEDVLAIGETDPVVAIFVGTLVKDYEDGRCLSGSSACRWYINEDLPDITDLYKRLQGKTVPIERVVLPGQDSDSIAALANIETKTVTELTALDLFDNEKTIFFCTATILDIAPQRWWFSSCTTCHKSATPHGSTYVCSNEWCPGTRACPRYKACFVVSDGQSQVEFVFFDRVAAQLIGKPLINLLRFGQPNGASLEDIVSAARDSPVTPREILAVISKKFRFVVSLSSKAFSDEELTPSYQVDRIDTEIEKRASFSVIKSKTPFLPSAAKQSALSAPTGSETPTRTDEDEIETEAPLIFKKLRRPTRRSTHASTPESSGKEKTSVDKDITGRGRLSDVRKELFPQIETEKEKTHPVGDVDDPDGSVAVTESPAQTDGKEQEGVEPVDIQKLAPAPLQPPPGGNNRQKTGALKSTTAEGGTKSRKKDMAGQIEGGKEQARSTDETPEGKRHLGPGDIDEPVMPVPLKRSLQTYFGGVARPMILSTSL